MELEPLKQAAQTAVKQSAGDLEPVVTTALAKGVRSSEFKMAAIGLGVAVLGGIGSALSLIPGPWMFVGAGILGGMSIFGYNVSRGLAKSNAAPDIQRLK